MKEHSAFNALGSYAPPPNIVPPPPPVRCNALLGVWTSTSKAIPPAGENVLCWCSDGLIRLMWREQFETFYMWSSMDDLSLVENEVTHWMSLPLPPNPTVDPRPTGTGEKQ